MDDLGRIDVALDVLLDPDKGRKGRLGYSINGVLTVPASAVSYYVRFADQSWAAVRHRGNIAPIPDAPVIVGSDARGKPVIEDFDPDEIATFIGTTGNPNALQVPPHTHAARTIWEYFIDDYLWLKLAARVVNVDNAATMRVYVTPGRYDHDDALKWWAGDEIDLTTYAPSTAGMWAWIVIGIDPDALALVAVAGTAQAIAMPLLPQSIPLVPFDWENHIALYAAKVRNGQTQLYQEEFEALLQTAHTSRTGSGGSSGSGGLSLGVGGTTKKIAPDGSEIITQVLLQPSVALIPREDALLPELVRMRVYNEYGVPRTINRVFASVDTVPVGADIILDILKNGSSIFADPSDRPIIADGANTGATTTIDDAVWGEGDYLQMEIVQVGSSVSGSDLTVHIRCG